MQVRTTRTGRALAVTAVAALSLGVAACGSDSDDATSSTTTVSTGGTADGSGLTVVEDGLDPLRSEELNLAAATSFAEVSAPGAIMAVRTPQGTWIATIGDEDWDKTTPMAADVNQRIGSLTKTFTATAILQLAEQGELSLDDPIDKYVPGMPNGDATLYELTAMRSGIPSYTFDESFQNTLFSNPDQPWTPQQLVDLVKGDEPMFAPGTMMFYSNTNYVLMGMVIEQVTGKPIQDVLQELIFDPVGLDHTVFPTDATFPEPHPQGYTMQGATGDTPTNATDWDPSWGWTAGAMISDLDDLLTWGEVLATGEGILSPDTQADRLDSFDFSVPVYVSEGQTAPQSPARAYGLGLGLALDWYGHEGELPGFNTYVQHYEPEGITLVVMVNSDISSGQCSSDTPTVPGGRTTGECDSPASHIGIALAEALGYPLAPPTASTANGTTDTTAAPEYYGTPTTER